MIRNFLLVLTILLLLVCILGLHEIYKKHEILINTQKELTHTDHIYNCNKCLWLERFRAEEYQRRAFLEKEVNRLKEKYEKGDLRDD